MLKKIAHTINYRPITTFGVLNAIHTLMYGIGYLFIDSSDFANTVLARHITELVSYPEVFGVFLIILGFMAILSLIKDKIRWVGPTSTIQGIFWLFVFLVYILNGSWALGIAIGLTWALISGYTGYSYAHRKEIAEHNALE